MGGLVALLMEGGVALLMGELLMEGGVAEHSEGHKRLSRSRLKKPPAEEAAEYGRFVYEEISYRVLRWDHSCWTHSRAHCDLARNAWIHLSKHVEVQTVSSRHSVDLLINQKAEVRKVGARGDWNAPLESGWGRDVAERRSGLVAMKICPYRG